MTATVRLITLWSGPLPSYLPLFLLTAGRNPAFEFVFVADSPAPHHLLDGGLPPNVIWIERAHADVVLQIGDRLGLPLDGVTPYKLCDFKPTFGHTLPDLVDGADFWGHIDCDLILGDLGAFIHDDLLDAYDLISLRGRQFVHGPLTLYRNVEAVNTLYTRADGWAQTLQDPTMHSFTESCHWWAWKGETRPPGTPDSFTDAVSRASDVRVYDEDHVEEEDPAVTPHSMRWEDGSLTELLTPRPIAFYHLVVAKRVPLFRVPTWRSLPDAFVITNSGIRDEAETVFGFQAKRLVLQAPRFARSLATRARARARRQFARAPS